MKNERSTPKQLNLQKCLLQFTWLILVKSNVPSFSVLRRFDGRIYITYRAINFYSKLYFILCFSLPVKTSLLVTETSQCASNSQLLHMGFHIAEFKNSYSSQLCHLQFFSNILLITFRLINTVDWPLSVCPGAICYAILVQRVFCYSFGSLPGIMTDAGRNARASGVTLQGLNPCCKL